MGQKSGRREAMHRQQDLAADIGKQLVWAGILWIIGSIIFIVAACKLCAPVPEPGCPPEPDCPGPFSHMW